MSLPALLRGIVPPMITPLSRPDALDVAGLERQIEHLISGGVAGLFILGTCGEGPALGVPLRRELIDRTCRQVDGRIPVLVGITDPSIAESLAIAKHAADAGADAVVASAPPYFRCGQAELGSFIRTMSARTPLPLFLYNMPSLTKATFSPETVRRAMDSEKIVGLKDSSGDMGYAHVMIQLAADHPRWSFLVGPEHLTGDVVLFGGHGGVNGGANVHPRLYVDLYEAAAARDLDRLIPLQREVLSLGRIYQFGGDEAAVVLGLKAALASLGICEDTPAEPFGPFPEEIRERIGEILSEIGVPAPG